MSSRVIGGDGPSDPAIVIRIKNVGSLIESQGGKTGKAVFLLAPQVLTNKVYDEMRKKLLEGFAAQGVDADVQVTTPPAQGKWSMPDIATGAVTGAAVVGIGAVLVKLLFRKGKK